MLSDNIKILRKKKGYSQETLAEQLHVKNLVLYHTEDKNISNRKALYMEEGRQYYTGHLYVPDDLEVLHL